MVRPYDRRTARQTRHSRIRKRVEGTEARPRLMVFRSNQHIYAQIVDDSRGHTLVTASTVESALKTRAAGMKPADAARLVGETAAERAKQKGIAQVVFDRGGYLYHGCVAALADGARAGGLEF